MISGDLDFINHMARYRRYRRTIIRAPKKKWASNFKDVNMETANTSGVAADVFVYKDLAENKSEATSPTPVIIKTGNFKVQGDYYVTNNSTEYTQGHSPTGMLYIVYMPEGIMPNSPASAQNILQNHPEWIMGWRTIDFDTISIAGGESVAVTKVSLTSRLKRNLNSGDKVICLVLIQNLPATTTFSARGMCQFWTCAN